VGEINFLGERDDFREGGQNPLKRTHKRNLYFPMRTDERSWGIEDERLPSNRKKGIKSTRRCQ